MAKLRNRNELYRRLAQTRLFLSQPLDALKRERLPKLLADIEVDLTAAEALVADAPPEILHDGRRRLGRLTGAAGLAFYYPQYSRGR